MLHLLLIPRFCFSYQDFIVIYDKNTYDIHLVIVSLLKIDTSCYVTEMFK